MTKTCSKCNKDKTLDNFILRKDRKTQQYQSWCKACKQVANTLRYNTDVVFRTRLDLKAKERRKRSPQPNRDRAKRWRLALRREVLTAYGNMCMCCGETMEQFLTIDHIQGNGNQHRREIKRRSGWLFYMWLKKHNFPDGFQVLCHSCNIAKHIYGTCPHNNQIKDLVSTLPCLKTKNETSLPALTC